MKGIKRLIFNLTFLALGAAFLMSCTKSGDKAPNVTWRVFKEFDLKTKNIGPNLKKVLNRKVKIAGFMIPLDYSSRELKEFLLVPFVPSCSHVPPPPENQIIKVVLKGNQKIEVDYDPIEVQGLLTVSTEGGDGDPSRLRGAFVLAGDSVGKYTRKKE